MIQPVELLQQMELLLQQQNSQQYLNAQKLNAQNSQQSLNTQKLNAQNSQQSLNTQKLNAQNSQPLKPQQCSYVGNSDSDADSDADSDLQKITVMSDFLKNDIQNTRKKPETCLEQNQGTCSKQQLEDIILFAPYCSVGPCISNNVLFNTFCYIVTNPKDNENKKLMENFAKKVDMNFLECEELLSKIITNRELKQQDITRILYGFYSSEKLTPETKEAIVKILKMDRSETSEISEVPVIEILYQSMKDDVEKGKISKECFDNFCQKIKDKSGLDALLQISELKQEELEKVFEIYIRKIKPLYEDQFQSLKNEEIVMEWDEEIGNEEISIKKRLMTQEDIEKLTISMSNAFRGSLMLGIMYAHGAKYPFPEKEIQTECKFVNFKNFDKNTIYELILYFILNFENLQKQQNSIFKIFDKIYKLVPELAKIKLHNDCYLGQFLNKRDLFMFGDLENIELQEINFTGFGLQKSWNKFFEEHKIDQLDFYNFDFGQPENNLQFKKENKILFENQVKIKENLMLELSKCSSQDRFLEFEVKLRHVLWEYEKIDPQQIEEFIKQNTAVTFFGALESNKDQINKDLIEKFSEYTADNIALNFNNIIRDVFKKYPEIKEEEINAFIERNAKKFNEELVKDQKQIEKALVEKFSKCTPEDRKSVEIFETIVKGVFQGQKIDPQQIEEFIARNTAGKFFEDLEDYEGRIRIGLFDVIKKCSECSQGVVLNFKEMVRKVFNQYSAIKKEKIEEFIQKDIACKFQTLVSYKDQIQKDLIEEIKKCFSQNNENKEVKLDFECIVRKIFKTYLQMNDTEITEFIKNLFQGIRIVNQFVPFYTMFKTIYQCNKYGKNYPVNCSLIGNKVEKNFIINDSNPINISEQFQNLKSQEESKIEESQKQKQDNTLKKGE